MYIYKITNLINGKIYIGQSIRDIHQRFSRHINDALNNKLDTHFARAIRKYGENNFVIELIDSAETQDELNQKEQYWIRYYDSIRHGYNETDAICKCGGNTYMSKTKREMRKIGNKIRASKLGSLNPRSRKVKCRSELTGEELVFDTMKECQKYFGESNHQFISRRINRKTNSLYLTEWNFAYLEEPYSDLEEYPIRRTRMKLLLTNLMTCQKEEFPSLTLLSKTLGVTIEFLRKGLYQSNGHMILKNYQIDILD